MKETKRVWKFFQYRECDAFAAYLEKMALEGWHLETVGLGMTFKKGEPKTVRYEIEVFSKATEYDTKAEPAAEEFSEYCETAGWEFVCAYRKFCIYRTENPDVVPIETDEMQRFENISKASMSLKRNMFVYTLFIYVLELFFFSEYSLLDTMVFLLTTFLFGITCWEFLIFIEEVVWRYRSRKSLAEGNSISYKKESLLMKLYSIIAPVLLILIVFISAIIEHTYYVLAIIAVLSGIVCLYHVLRIKLKLSREHSYVLRYAIFFLIYLIFVFVLTMKSRTADETVHQDFSNVTVPIHCYEFNDGKYVTEELFAYDKKDNFVSSWESYQIEYGENEKSYVSYEIVESKSDLILNVFWRKKLHPRFLGSMYELKKDDYKILEKEAERWEAVSFAQLDFLWREYMIRYPDRLIILQYDGEITPEIIEKVKNLKIEK